MLDYRLLASSSGYRLSQLQGQETVVVAYISDPENFYVQFVKSKNKLDALMDDIDAYCNSHEATPPMKLALGCPVIAKYSKDDGWYRAKVTGKKKCNNCSIR